MSAQFGLTNHEIKFVFDMLSKHKIDWSTNEVSIHISSYNEDADTYDIGVDPYIQVN